MADKDELIKAFESSVVGDELREISEETADNIIDLMAQPEILEAIPIVKYLSGAYNIYTAIREKHELKKLYRFFYELRKVSDKERIEFLKDLDDKPKYKKQTIERVLLVIQRLDESEKASVIGRLFRNRILHLLEEETFFRLSLAVERCYFSDMKALHENAQSSGRVKGDRTLLKSLSQIGLVDESPVYNKDRQEFAEITGRIGGVESISYNYTISKLGQDLLRFGF